mmetsp:Transcript_36998/g.86137  ORF Transcript_36998/g.86137 Transcript_36998/m.86137 type:complete len:296 (-) Transcript_36998:440-1327(-)
MLRNRIIGPVRSKPPALLFPDNNLSNFVAHFHPVPLVDKVPAEDCRARCLNDVLPQPTWLHRRELANNEELSVVARLLNVVPTVEVLLKPHHFAKLGGLHVLHPFRAQGVPDECHRVALGHGIPHLHHPLLEDPLPWRPHDHGFAWSNLEARQFAHCCHAAIRNLIKFRAIPQEFLLLHYDARTSCRECYLGATHTCPHVTDRITRFDDVSNLLVPPDKDHAWRSAHKSLVGRDLQWAELAKYHDVAIHRNAINDGAAFQQLLASQDHALCSCEHLQHSAELILHLGHWSGRVDR